MENSCQYSAEGALLLWKYWRPALESTVAKGCNVFGVWKVRDSSLSFTSFLTNAAMPFILPTKEGRWGRVILWKGNRWPKAKEQSFVFYLWKILLILRCGWQLNDHHERVQNSIWLTQIADCNIKVGWIVILDNQGGCPRVCWMPTLLCGQRADPALGEWGKFQAVIQGVRWCVGPSQVVGMKTWKVQVAPLFNTRWGVPSHITRLHRPRTQGQWWS